MGVDGAVGVGDVDAVVLGVYETCRVDVRLDLMLVDGIERTYDRVFC